MKPIEFKNTVKEELKVQGNILSENELSNAVTKFYLWLMKEPIEKAKRELANNPRLQKVAQEVEDQKLDVAKSLMRDPKFLNYLIAKSKEKE